jgi:hypothetical protein
VLEPELISGVHWLREWKASPGEIRAWEQGWMGDGDEWRMLCKVKGLRFGFGGILGMVGDGVGRAECPPGRAARLLGDERREAVQLCSKIGAEWIWRYGNINWRVDLRRWVVDLARLLVMGRGRRRRGEAIREAGALGSGDPGRARMAQGKGGDCPSWSKNDWVRFWSKVEAVKDKKRKEKERKQKEEEEKMEEEMMDMNGVRRGFVKSRITKWQNRTEEVRAAEDRHLATLIHAEYLNCIVNDEELEELITDYYNDKEEGSKLKEEADRAYHEAEEERMKLRDEEWMKNEKRRLDELEKEADSNWEWFVGEENEEADNKQIMEMARRIDAQVVDDQEWCEDEEVWLQNDPWFAKRYREHEEAEEREADYTMEAIDNRIMEEHEEELQHKRGRDEMVLEHMREEEEEQEVRMVTEEEEVMRMMFDEEAEEHRRLNKGGECFCLMCLGDSSEEGGWSD